MPFKPFETKMTEQQVIDGLKSTFGNEFTTPDVRAFCAMNDICLLYTSPSPRDPKISRMPSSA